MIPGTMLLGHPETQQKQAKIRHYLEHIGELTPISRGAIGFGYRFLDGFNSSEAYFRYLSSPGIRAWAIRCIKEGFMYECPHDGLKIFEPRVCQDHRACVICGNRHTNRLALPAMRLLNVLSLKLPDLYLTGIVFTLPRLLQKAIGYDNFKKFNDICLETIKEYHEGTMPAGVNASHTWHSKSPLEGRYPHNHSFWLNYGYNKASDRFEMIEKFYDVKKLRNIYRKRLNKAFGVTLPMVNLFVEYVRVDPNNEKKRRKILHMLTYAFRMPQKDITEHARGVRWDSKQRKYVQIAEPIVEFSQAQLAHITYVLQPPPNWRRVRWYGWLADGVRAKYLNKLDIAIEDTLEPPGDESEAGVRCPKCHDKCVPLCKGKHDSSNVITLDDALDVYGEIFLPWDPGGSREDDVYEPELQVPDYSTMSYEQIYEHEKNMIDIHDKRMVDLFTDDGAGVS